MSSKGNEWFTLQKYIDAARQVMDKIDLDPASCAAANEIVQATEYYDLATDGLTKRWRGNVWLNPPYGTTGETTSRYVHKGESNIKLFSSKLLASYECGDVRQAVFLSMANTEASWFVPLWDYLICFPYPRINFMVEGSLSHHIQGSCFIYLGENEQKFIEVFSQFGYVVRSLNKTSLRV
jgi:ParB family chromosome partitioning protein